LKSSKFSIQSRHLQLAKVELLPQSSKAVHQGLIGIRRMHAWTPDLIAAMEPGGLKLVSVSLGCDELLLHHGSIRNLREVSVRGGVVVPWCLQIWSR
jgi:hypothetical protein